MIKRLAPSLTAAIFVMSAAQAQAGVITFHFNGGGVSGAGAFTVAPNVSQTDPNPSCGTPGNNACRADPPGAYKITGVSGTFSDAGDGIVDAAITGLIPISPANERYLVFDPLVPTSLSFVDLTPPIPGPTGAFSYNNLFFPGGSPIDCAFPYAGTFVDVFGMAFTVAGGFAVNLWGDGDLFGPGTKTYGVRVTDGHSFLVDQFAGVRASASVPEPASWLLMTLGFGALGFGLRRRNRLAQPA